MLIGLVALWAAAEAIFLPVVPDVLAMALAAWAPRQAGRVFAVLVAGSLAGSLVLFGWASLAPAGATAVVSGVPGISPAMVADARTAVAGGDPAAMAGVGPGTPVKVWTLAWATGPGSVAPWLLGVVLNRLTRVGPLVLAAAVAGRFLGGAIRRRPRLVLAGYLAAWAIFYAWYLGAR